MAVLIDKNTRLIVQGITGREGTFHAEAAALTGRLIADKGAGAHDIAQWIAVNAPRLAEAKPVIDSILAQPETTVSRLTVAAARVRGTATG